MINSEKIREQFISFFKEKGHSFVRSSPVIPVNDPTLLFTNAGMNQFKEIFLGEVEPEILRAVNSQKCIRAGGKHNDLEEVGKDGFHHTFFEMLGNWSFGDYYKKEAVIWAWELLTEVWSIPKKSLYATVHRSDEETFNVWQKETDIDTNHIEYHGDKDNFWEMGETGPCGPCSEIHYDLGPDFCDKKDEKDHVCRVNGDCHRFIELWNLVFIQYNRDEKGELHNLKNQFVDTGAGFERLCQVLQGKQSNYETDLFYPLIKELQGMSQYNYSKDPISFRVLADHIRTLSFALADGGMPSNEGRGYVLRRILRRAARFGRKIGFKEPFLYKLVQTVVNLMGNHFAELRDREKYIELVIKSEEERFNVTLDNGLERLNQIMEKKVSEKSKKILSGKEAFMLYDTYGFPLDLTVMIASENGFSTDQKDFSEEMEKQRLLGRQSHNFKYKTDSFNFDEWIKLSENILSSDVNFVGYSQNTVDCRILMYSLDDENNINFVLDNTPFYAESGGQVGDKGRVYNDICLIKVVDVIKKNDLIIHVGKLKEGTVTKKQLTAELDSETRNATARNHTATHLLHSALRMILGEHIQQKGSLVHPDYLRFDFSHFKALSEREIELVENVVNDEIRRCSKVYSEEMSVEEAKRQGATALFGEKYQDRVRVISVLEFSKELCGGTHVSYTGEIGIFKILSETSISAGVRRVEAVTGRKSEEFVMSLQRKIETLRLLLEAPADKLIEKAEKLLEERKMFSNELQKLSENQRKNQVEELIKKSFNYKLSSEPEIIFKVLVEKVNCQNNNELKEYGDFFKNIIKSGIAIFYAIIDGKVSLLSVVTDDLQPKYNAGKIINQVAQLIDGRGGGKPSMAMAGGKNIEKVKLIHEKITEILDKF